MRDDAIFFEAAESPSGGLVWRVGALVRAVGDALHGRFSPVSVQGEIAGFSQASSGHCYFSLKDDSASIRCAMFRRAANMVDAQPKNGDVVRLSGRLAVYEARGDLQLIVESISQAGRGTWFEQFLRLKNKLEAEGLFDPARKRQPSNMPRGIGLVTSPGSAAMHDVAAALKRRAPHVPVWLSAASVQGRQAPGELAVALRRLYSLVSGQPHHAKDMSIEHVCIDAILLVRGGGSPEDLAAFNDEALARTIAESPVPVICGVGHETDFTIADFVCDVRAPTPTAAAELCATDRAACLARVEQVQARLRFAAQRAIETRSQRVDGLAQRLAIPHLALVSERLALQRMELALDQHLKWVEQGEKLRLCAMRENLQSKVGACLQQASQRLARAALGLEHLSPQRVLERGYSLLYDESGSVVSHIQQAQADQALTARLLNGLLRVRVQAVEPD